MLCWQLQGNGWAWTSWNRPAVWYTSSMLTLSQSDCLPNLDQDAHPASVLVCSMKTIQLTVPHDYRGGTGHADDICLVQLCGCMGSHSSDSVWLCQDARQGDALGMEGIADGSCSAVLVDLFSTNDILAELEQVPPPSCMPAPCSPQSMAGADPSTTSTVCLAPDGLGCTVLELPDSCRPHTENQEVLKAVFAGLSD